MPTFCVHSTFTTVPVFGCIVELDKSGPCIIFDVPNLVVYTEHGLAIVGPDAKANMRLIPQRWRFVFSLDRSKSLTPISAILDWHASPNLLLWGFFSFLGLVNLFDGLALSLVCGQKCCLWWTLG